MIQKTSSSSRGGQAEEAMCPGHVKPTERDSSSAGSPEVLTPNCLKAPLTLQIALTLSGKVIYLNANSFKYFEII